MVKLSTVLWYTNTTFSKYEQRKTFGVSCGSRINYQNENWMTNLEKIWDQTRAYNEVLYTKPIPKNVDTGKALVGVAYTR